LSQVRVLGEDDWAWRKGQNFGTILVDLERSQVVDLLPTRSADSLVEWLAQHPEVTTVSRDRQGVYAEGARLGAPKAVQVADRFHLVLNLIQAVERHLAVNRRHLQIARSSAPPLPPSPTKEEVKNRTKPIRVRSGVLMQQMEVARQRQQQRLELFETVKQMRAAGMKVSQNREATWPVSAAHRQMDLARRAAGKKPDAAPAGNARIVPRLLTSTLGGGLSAWAHAVRGDSEIWLCRLLLGTRKVAVTVAPAESRGRKGDLCIIRRDTTWGNNSNGSRHLSPQVAAALLSKVRPELTNRQAQIVDLLKRLCPGFAEMRKIVLGFRTILRAGKPATLHRWMEQARKTGIHSLVRFVRTLKQDLQAVESAVSTPWSNGPVEGHINRLKMLKRQMYGRAGIELLRARLLPEPEFSDP
jgi:transposase